MKLLRSCFFVGLLLLSLGCKQKFDQEKWSQKKEWDYPHRNKMVKDLLKNHELKGKPFSEVRAMLGEPDDVEGKRAYYDIVMKYGSDMEPTFSKELVISFNADSVVTTVEVQEHKN